MNISFYKYQGAGNDFIMVDNRNLEFKASTALIAKLCNRRFGIGADGLILLENEVENSVDFKMVYYNSDGNESTLCGNGGRCIVAFAKQLGIIQKSCHFMAIDGLHQAHFEAELVSLSMPDVHLIQSYHSESFYLNTGSPHHVDFLPSIAGLDVKKEGARIRNSNLYAKAGSNINFVEVQDNFMKIRTYERGVEDETLACGTGVTAAAIAAHFAKKITGNKVAVQAIGGDLAVRFLLQNQVYTHIELVGPAKFVFKGEIECEA